MPINNCLFCKIREKEIPANFVYEDDEVMVFPDIHPQKPVHLLIVPKQHVSEFLVVDDHLLFAKLGKVMQQMIKDNTLEKKGYKITINGGGLQDVDHLHMHLLGPMK
ncbi:histidine triad nucleotide-binding protein [soil metagenome]